MEMKKFLTSSSVVVSRKVMICTHVYVVQCIVRYAQLRLAPGMVQYTCLFPPSLPACKAGNVTGRRARPLIIIYQLSL